MNQKRSASALPISGVRSSTTTSSCTKVVVEHQKEPSGQVIFTGPDGIGDHKTTVKDPTFVGHVVPSPETTGNLDYICKGPKVDLWM